MMSLRRSMLDRSPQFVSKLAVDLNMIENFAACPKLHEMFSRLLYTDVMY